MVETAAHLVDQVFPPLPVRQWVLAVPKRLRYFLQRDSEALGAVLHILLRVIEARLRQRSGFHAGRLGAVSFVQRFGSALNAHVHFHCCVIDGVFAVGEDAPRWTGGPSLARTGTPVRDRSHSTKPPCPFLRGLPKTPLGREEPP